MRVTVYQLELGRSECCISEKTTTLVYKNIISFFFFPFITQNVRTSKSEKELKTVEL